MKDVPIETAAISLFGDRHWSRTAMFALQWRDTNRGRKTEQQKDVWMFPVSSFRGISSEPASGCWKNRTSFYPPVFLLLFGAGLPSEGDWLIEPTFTSRQRPFGFATKQEMYHALRLFGCIEKVVLEVSHFCQCLRIYSPWWDLMGLGRKTQSAQDIMEMVEMSIFRTGQRPLHCLLNFRVARIMPVTDPKMMLRLTTLRKHREQMGAEFARF